MKGFDKMEITAETFGNRRTYMCIVFTRSCEFPVAKMFIERAGMFILMPCRKRKTVKIRFMMMEGIKRQEGDQENS